LRGVELEVRGWSTDDLSGETVVICRLLDGSAGEIPAGWTDLPLVAPVEEPLGVVGSPALGVCSASALRRCGGVVRDVVEPAAKTEEAMMAGQLALQMGEALVAAAVWETLPPERQRQLTIQLARLLARLVEAERDE
jgi:hypothetical protein